MHGMPDAPPDRGSLALGGNVQRDLALAVVGWLVSFRATRMAVGVSMLM